MGSKLSYGTRYLMWDVNWGSQPPSLLPLRFPHQPRVIGAVLQRRPLIIEPGGLEGEGFESGLLKIGIEGGGSLIS